MNGERIETCRKALGWSRDTLARKLSVTPMSVWKWEHNKCTPHAHLAEAMRQLFFTNGLKL